VTSALSVFEGFTKYSLNIEYGNNGFGGKMSVQSFCFKAVYGFCGHMSGRGHWICQYN